MPEGRWVIRVTAVLGWKGTPEGLPRRCGWGAPLDLGKGDGGGIEKAGEPKHRGGLGQVWAGFREGQLAEPELCFGKKGGKAVVTVRMEQAGTSFQNSKLLGLGSDCQPWE